MAVDNKLQKGKKIGIDIRALGGEIVGIGTYIKGFLWSLSQVKDDQNQYFLYTDQDSVETIYKLSLLPKEKFILRYFPTKVWSLDSWYIKVWQDAKKKQLDLFYSPHSTLFSFFPNLKTIFMVHDLSAILFPQMHTFKVRLFSGKFFLSHACKKARLIIVPSFSTKQDLEKIIPASYGKIKVIYNGLSMKKIATRRGASLRDESNRFAILNFPYLLYVGTIEPRKNLAALIEAFHRFKEKDKLGYKLIIAGKKGWLYEPVFEKVGGLRLENEVIFAGYVSEDMKQSLYKKATAFVFPSFYEGFGLPVLEAMSLGVPVITSNCSSLPEIVGGNYRFLVDPYSKESIYTGLKRILTLSSKERKQLIMSNKERAQGFSWLKNAQEWLKVVSEIP